MPEYTGDLSAWASGTFCEKHLIGRFRRSITRRERISPSQAVPGRCRIAVLDNSIHAVTQCQNIRATFQPGHLGHFVTSICLNDSVVRFPVESVFHRPRLSQADVVLLYGSVGHSCNIVLQNTGEACRLVMLYPMVLQQSKDCLMVHAMVAVCGFTPPQVLTRGRIAMR